MPDEFWTIDSYVDGARIIIISCPCGESPTVAETRCVECVCGRFYLSLGERVRVARPEDVAAAVPD